MLISAKIWRNPETWYPDESQYFLCQRSTYILCMWWNILTVDCRAHNSLNFDKLHVYYYYYNFVVTTSVTHCHETTSEREKNLYVYHTFINILYISYVNLHFILLYTFMSFKDKYFLSCLCREVVKTNANQYKLNFLIKLFFQNELICFHGL